MTIDEAIEILSNEAEVAVLPDFAQEVEAFKLGIEALKLCVRNRAKGGLEVPLLPGETEE